MIWGGGIITQETTAPLVVRNNNSNTIRSRNRSFQFVRKPAKREMLYRLSCEKKMTNKIQLSGALLEKDGICLQLGTQCRLGRQVAGFAARALDSGVKGQAVVLVGCGKPLLLVSLSEEVAFLC
uniref:Uncharacterized protein n=1 Tax=Sphaerodactylus townsendi TaxID=933632 RepID=A0ACB8EBG6_9SAUR